jgi:hypothetical protein
LEASANSGWRSDLVPAGPPGLDNLSAGEQFIEPGVAIGVNAAAEVLQMRLRMLAFAIG